VAASPTELSLTEPSLAMFLTAGAMGLPPSTKFSPSVLNQSVQS
jgi:hypothetical protein